MSSTTTTDVAAQQVVTKRPIRGAIWGLLLGLGLAMYAILFAIIPFTDWLPLILVVLVGVAIGVLWAFFAPAKGPSSPPPAATAAPEPEAAPAESEAPAAADEPVADEEPTPEAPDAATEPGPDDAPAADDGSSDD